MTPSVVYRDNAFRPKIYVHCIKGIGLDLRERFALELMNLADRFGTTDARGIAIGVNIES